MNIKNITLPMAKIYEFCIRWKVKEFSLFGSILREDFNPKSDVDVLLSFKDDAQWGLLEFTDMQQELEKIFDRKVDILEKEGIKNPFRKKEIFKTHQVIYAA